MKKLKALNIIFSTHDTFMSEVKGLLKSPTPTKKNVISFDSLDTFKKVMTPNKLEILIAIARMHPASIYQLAKLINREFPHVLKDCRSLETMGFIVLKQSEGAKKQLAPKLSFNYDVIRVKSTMEELFPISEESNKILVKSMVG